MNAAPSSPSEFRRGWRPLVAAMLGVACGASPIPFNVIGLVIGPINAETGWTFESISLFVTIYGVAASFVAPFVGALADKHGVRPVALGATALFGLVFASIAILPTSYPVYLAFWALIGIVGIGSTPVTWSRTITAWFQRSRGLALGLMLLGTSIAAFVVPQIAKPVIENYGWRAAFPALALLPLLVALPIGLLWFRDPRPGEVDAAASGEQDGVTLPEALRGRHFWLLAASIAIVAGAYGGLFIHLAEMVKLHGAGLGGAASVLSIMALGILAGRIIVGALFDRFWAPGIAFPALLLPAISCWLLMGTGTPLPLLLVAGFLIGFAAGAESDVIAFLAARYFGIAHFGRIYGLLYMVFGICTAISPIFYGRARDLTGGYDAALWVASIMFAVGGALLLLLGRYPGGQLKEAAT